jgi:hypothetical protein
MSRLFLSSDNIPGVPMVKNTAFMRAIMILITAALLSTFAFSANPHPSLDNIGLYHPLHEELSFDPLDYGEGWIVSDENDDGMVDYGIYFDDEGIKVFEAVDFDKNGQMDDFISMRMEYSCARKSIRMAMA